MRIDACACSKEIQLLADSCRRHVGGHHRLQVVVESLFHINFGAALSALK